MKPPRRGTRAQHTLLGPILLLSLSPAWAPGCAGTSGSDRALREALAADANALEAALARAAAPPPDTLRVRLAFGARADLDLYLTDPAQETAYFANTPTKRGAELSADLRCDDPAPRVETVALARPMPGRYRVGVDYPQACGDDAGPVSFVVSFERGARRESRRGAISPGEFLAIVLEAEID